MATARRTSTTRTKVPAPNKGELVFGLAPLIRITAKHVNKVMQGPAKHVQAAINEYEDVLKNIRVIEGLRATIIAVETCPALECPSKGPFAVIYVEPEEDPESQEDIDRAEAEGRVEFRVYQRDEIILRGSLPVMNHLMRLFLDFSIGIQLSHDRQLLPPMLTQHWHAVRMAEDSLSEAAYEQAVHEKGLAQMLREVFGTDNES